jgi:hypothetical protein
LGETFIFSTCLATRSRKKKSTEKRKVIRGYIGTAKAQNYPFAKGEG